MNLNDQGFIVGSDIPVLSQATHLVTKNNLLGPFPIETKQIVLGMGCFWGTEKLFYNLSGIYITAAGYSNGITENPTYEQVCSGRTGHAETVLIVYYPNTLNLKNILKIFFEMHDPTQLNRQGNDIGTQYRSILTYETEEERLLMTEVLEKYNKNISAVKNREIKTFIQPRTKFFYAEELHQQYLIKNPHGYCNHGYNGVSCNL